MFFYILIIRDTLFNELLLPCAICDRLVIVASYASYDWLLLPVTRETTCQRQNHSFQCVSNKICLTSIISVITNNNKKILVKLLALQVFRKQMQSVYTSFEFVRPCFPLFLLC